MDFKEREVKDAKKSWARFERNDFRNLLKNTDELERRNKVYIAVCRHWTVTYGERCTHLKKEYVLYVAFDYLDFRTTRDSFVSKYKMKHNFTFFKWVLSFIWKTR